MEEAPNDLWLKFYDDTQRYWKAVAAISHIIYGDPHALPETVVHAVQEMKQRTNDLLAQGTERNSHPFTWTLPDQELRDMGKRVEERIRLLEHCLSIRFQGIESDQKVISSRVKDVENRVTDLEGKEKK